MGLAILAGLAYLIRHRLNLSDRRDGVQAYLDNNMESDTNQRVVRTVAGDSRTPELSEQGLVELQHPHGHPAVEMD